MISTSGKLNIMLSMLMLFLVNNVAASEYSRAHSANSGIVSNGYATVPVYKFIDSEGRVSYSTSSSTDFIQAEEITIITPPSSQQLEASNQRLEEMKAAVEQFDVARAEREAIREQNEIKRLQRLALINQARSPVVTREFIYPAYPYRPRKKRGGHHDIPRHIPLGPGLPLPPSSFPVTLHR